MAAMHLEINSEAKNRLLNMNEVEYVNYLVQKYAIEPLTFLWDDLYVTDQEVSIPAEHFPPDFNGFPGKSYPKQVITYHIPFIGERDLLKYAPSTLILWSTNIDAHGDHISFDIVNWHGDAAPIKSDADSTISHIRDQHKKVDAEVQRFNDNLRAEAQAAVQSRKQDHLRIQN